MPPTNSTACELWQLAGLQKAPQGPLETMVRHLGKVLKARQGSSKQSQIFKGEKVNEQRSGESRKASAARLREPIIATTFS